MINKLICFIWGHKIVAKEFTGNDKIIETLYGPQTVQCYIYKRTKFCLRCGCKNKHYEE